jgi:hypothetical protein
MRLSRFRFARIIALTLTALIVVAVTGMTIWRMSLKSKNRARLKAISERGEPVDSMALNQSYAYVTDTENAAFVWLDGAAQMTAEAADGDGWKKFKIPSRGTNLTEVQVKWARGIVESNEEALETFRKAATLTKARYPVDLTPGFNALLPHLATVKKMARLLQAEVVVAVADGDLRRATDAVKTMLAISRSLSSEPLLISQLVAHATDGIAFGATDYLMNRVTLTDAQLAELGAAFLRSEDPNSLYVALVGERATFASVAKDPYAYLSTVGGPTPSSSVSQSAQELGWGFVRMTGFFERDFGFGVDVLTTNIAFAKLPDPDRFSSRTNWSAVETRIHEGRYFLSGILLPALGKAVYRDTEDRTKARIAQIVLAIERYRLAHANRLPENVDALVPTYLTAHLSDPFDGRPLRFKPRESGYVIYSVGPDTVDDGGLERPPKYKDKDPWDVTFIVERAESR